MREFKVFSAIFKDPLVNVIPAQVNVIPAQAGICNFLNFIDSRLRGSDERAIIQSVLNSNDANLCRNLVEI